MAYSLKYKFRKFIKCDCLCCVKIPAAIIDGKYRLRLEGYDNEHPQKAILIKESSLEFYPDFLSIVIQSNRKVFRNGMSGNLTHYSKFIFKFIPIEFDFSTIPYNSDSDGSQTLYRSSHHIHYGIKA